MAWTDEATALVGISGGVVALAAAGSSYGANRRSQYDRVRAETSTLTTGEVAASRHKVGSALQAATDDAARKAAISPALYADFFAVLWTFERLYGLFVSLKPIVPRGGRLTRPERLLLLNVRGAAETWVGFVDLKPDSIGSTEVSSRGVRNLHTLAQALNEPRGVWDFVRRRPVDHAEVKSRRSVMRELS